MLCLVYLVITWVVVWKESNMQRVLRTVALVDPNQAPQGRRGA